MEAGIDSHWQVLRWDPSRLRRQAYLMLIAYMDESGHSSDPAVHFSGMGGLVAECDAWTQFEGEWEAALCDAGIEGAFHMRDFAHCAGPYKGWCEDKRRALFGRLVRAIVNAKAVPVGCVISLDDYRAAPSNVQEILVDPYFIAFQWTTRGAALQALPKPYPFEHTTEMVAMIYAYQSEFGAIEPKNKFVEKHAGRAEQLWHAMKNSTDFGHWMGSYGSSCTAELYPLQAADLFAYEITKEFENLVSRPTDTMRWALRQILAPRKDKNLLLRFVDAHEMRQLFLEGIHKPDHPAVQDVQASVWLRRAAVRDLFRQRMGAIQSPDKR